MALQSPRGMHDIFPDVSRVRQHITQTMRAVVERYGYGEISTPVCEFSDVFHRTLGDTSDVVAKETYSFADRGGESLTLRPEFTAGVVRAFIAHKLYDQLPLRYWYHGPAFRYERPQKGRCRQFHQFGVEYLGVAEPFADVEVIAMAMHALEVLGLQDQVVLHINSLGDAQSRTQYRAALVEYFSDHRAQLSSDSQQRLQHNPLRILDSKSTQDQQIVEGAPGMQQHFTAQAQEFFAQVEEGLTALGIAYTRNPRIVRGLDYYNHTVFEVLAGALGSQNAVLSGGRYDGLVEAMGGTPTPGMGWAAGMERLEMLVTQPSDPARPVVVIPLQSDAGDRIAALALAQKLRQAAQVVDVQYRGNLSKRLKRAAKAGARWAVLLPTQEGGYADGGKLAMAGAPEAQSSLETCVLRDLDSGEQRDVTEEQLFRILADEHKG